MLPNKEEDENKEKAALGGLFTATTLLAAQPGINAFLDAKDSLHSKNFLKSVEHDTKNLNDIVNSKRKALEEARKLHEFSVKSKKIVDHFVRKDRGFPKNAADEDESQNFKRKLLRQQQA